MTYQVEVQTDVTGKWYSNYKQYATFMEAREAGSSLFMRWTAVREWRVVYTGEGKSYYWDHTMGLDEPLKEVVKS